MTARAYGQPSGRKARPWSGTDPRYGSYRWKVKTRLPVLQRDGYRCWVTGCPQRGDVCDHIDPVSAATTDAEFYDTRRLRASCRSHNIGRSYAPELDQLARGSTAKDRPVGRPTAARPPSEVITGDYTRLSR